MNRKLAALATVFVFATSTVSAGVVLDMVSKDPSGSVTDKTKIYAQDKFIRIEQVSGSDDATMIFRGHEFLIVNHSEKSYMVIDEAMLAAVSDQISAAMKQMESQLAGMPAEQRAMVEKMMKGQMGNMMGGAKDKAPPPKAVAMGYSEWKSRKCQQFAVYENEVKTQQVCAAKLDDVDGSEELIDAFRGMASFMLKLTESMPMGANKQSNPLELMNQIDGFPIHTLEYRNDKVTSESSLESLVEQELNTTMFEAPDGYKRSDPMMRR